MTRNSELKEKAIELRKAGLTYSEILLKIPVAKSTLSDWLFSVGLSKKQKQRITEKRLAAAIKGGVAKKEKRMATVSKILDTSKAEIGKLSQREIWLIGAALYWAEGSKEKEYRPGSGIKFTNSDPEMIKFFLFWLKNSLRVTEEEIYFDLYLHDMYRDRVAEIISFWEEQTGYSRSFFKGMYFKRNKANTKRRNVGDNYMGVLRVMVRKSSKYTRMVAGWVSGIVQFTR